MAKSWNDTLDGIVQDNMQDSPTAGRDRLSQVIGAPGSEPRFKLPSSLPGMSVGPSYHSLIPQRDPNDPLDQAIRTAGGAIRDTLRNNAQDRMDIDMTGGTGGFPMGSAALSFAQTPSAINTNNPALRDAARSSLGMQYRGLDQNEALRRIQAIPDRAAPGGPNLNSFGNRFESGAALPEQAIQGDYTLAANRSPISYNPQNMGDYEYGGMFNGKPVYFHKPNAQNQMLNNAMTNILEYQRKYPDNPMTEQIGQLLTAMNINPNSESTRNLQGAQAEYQRAHAGAIPSQIEESQAKAKHYGRETPFTLGPGQRAFAPQGGNQQAIQIAEGAAEKPGAANAVDKMDEFDKVRYQGLMHLMQNSIDPEMQKRAAAGLDEIEGKYQPKGKQNLPARDEAYKRFKATGKYTDDQINARLSELGLR